MGAGHTPGGTREVGYPSHRETDVALRDGSTVHVRPVRRGDLSAVRDFLQGLSRQSRAFRFFSASINLEREAERSVDVDYVDRFALVAEAGLEPRVVGHAIYIRMPANRAEAAFAVADEFQGRGLGTILLAHLAQAAQEHGIDEFVAEVMPENHRMVEVFRESGFRPSMHASPGWIDVEIPTSLSPEALERFDRRDQISAEAAVRAVLSPSSIAVVGASRDRGTIAGEVFHNIVEAGFPGPVYPINLHADEVQGVRAWPTVLDTPQPVDLAVVVVPAAGVVDVARQCAKVGVRSLVVISAGFAETGPDGRSRQDELTHVCREAGMRLVGPNCMGVMNTDPRALLNATFAPLFPAPGNVGFLSQSGALGLAVMDYANVRGLGLSSFVSVGNKADISGNDLVRYWETDPRTEVVLLYLESFGNPRTFGRISRRVGRTKPIVAVKSGRSAAGARATSSHTGALLAASDVTVDALFNQAGVIRTDSLPEMFDVALLLAEQPPPRGHRIGILTNAGGPGILCADACEAGGLDVAALPDATREALAAFLPPEASFGNPVDMIASATAEGFGRAIDAMAPAFDALIVIFVPPLVTRAEDVAREIRRAVDRLHGSIPVLAVFMSSAGAPGQLQEQAPDQQERRIPTYAFPEDAARALVRAARWNRWRERREGRLPEFTGVRRDEAVAIVASALSDGPRWLSPAEVTRLLSCYGLPLATTRLVSTPEEAIDAANAIRGPVVLKAVAEGLVHKADVGGVRLSLTNAADVDAAARAMARDVERAGYALRGYVVQPMVPSGVEMLVGVVHDPTFGPVVACGAGGAAVELLKDIAVRLAPLTDDDAADMVRSLATFPLLDGYRGAPKSDVPALEDVLLRVSALVEAHPAIAEMDCNPVVVHEHGAVIVDVRVRIEPASPELPPAARRA
ncbi:MAG TPA: GNAT family N-acetyltransferase [Actinomycetota bacterium]